MTRPSSDDHDRAADELGQRELPADQQPQHDAQLDHQVGEATMNTIAAVKSAPRANRLFASAEEA